MKQSHIDYFDDVCQFGLFISPQQHQSVKMLLLDGDLSLSEEDKQFVEAASAVDLCKWLEDTQIARTVQCANENEMLSFDAVASIPLLFLHILDDPATGRSHCFNIYFLHELITRPGAVNPYTQVPLSNKQKRAIKRRYLFVDNLMSVLLDSTHEIIDLT
jgi:hypothetical protein